MHLESVIGSPCLKNQSIDAWAKPGANRWARRAPRLAGAPGTAHIEDERQIAILGSVVQHDAQPRTVGLEWELPVIFDETEFLEFVPEDIHARTRRADHLRERFL